MEKTAVPATLQDPWGARARDWAEIEDEGSRDLFEVVLDRLAVGPGQSYLDVGCGSGLACQLAASRGAAVSGLDASPGLLQIARERVPEADFRHGDMASLPFDSETFDRVSFVNTLFFASDRVAALRESRRVLRPGGRVAAIMWTSPDRIESMAFLSALGPLLPPLPELALFADRDELGKLAADAGFTDPEVTEVPWVWDYPDLETATRGWLSVGLTTLAIAASGEAAVRSAITDALAPFRRDDGGYRLENVVNCLVATA